MSMSGTPTEFLKLGILEPTDTLNTLVDLNGQWRKVDAGVKDVNTKADTNASNISSLNTQVHDNTENITNILDTNVNQQNDIDLLKTKVQTLETHDGDYETRITNNTNGVQENSELINDLKEDVSGIHLSIGTVPEGETVEGQISGIDTRVTALENSGTVEALETRVGRVEDSLGTVPSGSTVQGQIDSIVSDVGSVPSGSTVQGQIDSIVSDVGSVPSGNTVQGQIDNIDSQLTGTLSGNDVPFRFSIDGEGNYGYLKADDSFVPFSENSLRPYPNGLTQFSPSSLNPDTFTTKPYVVLKDRTNNFYLYDILNDTLTPTDSRILPVACRFAPVSGGIKDIITGNTYNYEENVMYVISGEHINKFAFNGTSITRTYNGNTYTLTTTTSNMLSRLYNIESSTGKNILMEFTETSSITSKHSLFITDINTTSASVTDRTYSDTVVHTHDYGTGYYEIRNTVSGFGLTSNDTTCLLNLVGLQTGCYYGQPTFFVVDVTPYDNRYLLKKNGYVIL